MEFFLYLIFSLVKGIFASPVTLNGKEFISFDLASKTNDARQSLVQLRFRSIHPNGLLAYSKGTNGHFLRLEIIHGRLQ